MIRLDTIGLVAVLVIFALAFVLMGTRLVDPYRKRERPEGAPPPLSMHWLWNLIALACWVGAYALYPANRNAYADVPRPLWMIIPAGLLVALGFVSVVIGVGRRRKGR